jgi:hypothetical protein
MRKALLGVCIALTLLTDTAVAQRPRTVQEDFQVKLNELYEEGLRLRAAGTVAIRTLGPIAYRRLINAIARWQREVDKAVTEAMQSNIRVPRRIERLSLQLEESAEKMEADLIRPARPAAPSPVEPPPLPPREAYPPEGPPVHDLEEAMFTPPGMPGGRCWGAVPGQTLVARDPDRNVQLALTRECIGGNGSGSRQ